MLIQPTKQFWENLAVGLFAILGVSFWFFLAFPFENHNESYSFIYVLKNSNFSDTFTKNMFGASNLRFMLQLFIFALYKLTGGQIYAHQLFNYAVTISAWFLVALAVRERKIFSLTGLIVGGFFFSGYIYLFHLHGLGYAPVLLLISFLIYFFDYKQTFDNFKIIVTFLFTIVIYFFHPAALLVFIGYFCGFLLEKFKYTTKIQFLLHALFLSIASAIVIITWMIADDNYTSSAFVITSYKMLEAHKLISLVSFILTIIAISSIESLMTSYKLAIGILTGILTIWFYLNNVPIVIIWIIVSLVKMIILRKWSIAFLIITTAFLPLSLSSGTPTYAIYVILACTIALPYGWATLENKIRFISIKIVVPVYIICFIIIALLRNGTNLPIVYPLTNPILAEKEKTYQLKTIMNWVLNSNYREYDLELYRDKYNPSVDPKAAIERSNIPPTTRGDVKIYMEMIRGFPAGQINPSKKLIVTFGNEKIENLKLVKRIDGKFAGSAMVFSDSTNLNYRIDY